MDWHGWSLSTGGPALHVGPLPGRKSVCLYSVNGSVLSVHAYFRSEDAAREALGVLDGLLSPGAGNFLGPGRNGPAWANVGPLAAARMPRPGLPGPSGAPHDPKGAPMDDFQVSPTDADAGALAPGQTVSIPVTFTGVDPAQQPVTGSGTVAFGVGAQQVVVEIAVTIPGTAGETVEVDAIEVDPSLPGVTITVESLTSAGAVIKVTRGA